MALHSLSSPWPRKLASNAPCLSTSSKSLSSTGLPTSGTSLPAGADSGSLKVAWLQDRLRRQAPKNAPRRHPATASGSALRIVCPLSTPTTRQSTFLIFCALGGLRYPRVDLPVRACPGGMKTDLPHPLNTWRRGRRERRTSRRPEAQPEVLLRGCRLRGKMSKSVYPTAHRRTPDNAARSND